MRDEGSLSLLVPAWGQLDGTLVSARVGEEPGRTTILRT